MQRSKLQRITLDRTQLNEQLQVSARFVLTPEQKHYLCHVLRLSTGAEFIALDGMGHGWLTQIHTNLQSNISTNLVQAQILAEIPNYPEAEIKVMLAIAMPKGNTIESVIRQAAELGVRQILPMWSDRTAIKPNTPLGSQKLERWQRIAQEATELSWQAYVPQIASPCAFKDLIAAPAQMRQTRLICVTHQQDVPHLLTYLTNSPNNDLNSPQIDLQDDAKAQGFASESILIATGAEGGWTVQEEALAIANHWQPVSLGDRILSAITAPVVALAIIRAALEARSES
ncbi:16S rRNA (uracil(1498)-N(3))-methyltransferase [Tumidithrix elongata RA019]|uniref:Ribosomal RNA small subunit methyltransferase E n=1 Tax=Tumidithrix elongata BACA0141 TaxID=2716417 RepID=A0AAW9PX82_9CYAN|nr:16S rRNA (uracil(1498)-N(3))-methyltransferase [Tumidithrix elongata RA019]